jgi:pimeloyl-ACP methyl ester carboxylesterase
MDLNNLIGWRLRLAKRWQALGYLLESVSRKENSSGLLIRCQNPRSRTLFLHGTGDDPWFPAAALYERLLGEGIEVCAHALPGHGIHGSDRFTLDHCKSFPDDINTDGCQFIVGYSLGSLMAAQLLDRFKAAVLVATPSQLTPGIESLSEMRVVRRKSFWDQTKYYGSHILPALGTFRRHDFPNRKFKDQIECYKSSASVIM